MKTEEIVESILDSMRSELTDFINKEGSITSSVEYEERILELSRKFSRGILTEAVGKIPKSRNLKKSPDEFRSPGNT